MDASNVEVLESVKGALDLFYRGRLDDSRRMFHQAADLEPLNLDALYGVALTSLGIGEIGTAEIFFSRVLDAYPSTSNAMYHLGLIALMRGDARSARAWFKQTLATQPDHRPATARLAAQEASR